MVFQKIKQHPMLLMIIGYIKMKEIIIMISIKCTLNNVWKKEEESMLLISRAKLSDAQG